MLKISERFFLWGSADSSIGNAPLLLLLSLFKSGSVVATINKMGSHPFPPPPPSLYLAILAESCMLLLRDISDIHIYIIQRGISDIYTYIYHTAWYI